MNKEINYYIKTHKNIYTMKEDKLSQENEIIQYG